MSFRAGRLISFGAEWLAVVWMGHSLFVFSLSEGHASCLVDFFSFLAQGEGINARFNCVF